MSGSARRVLAAAGIAVAAATAAQIGPAGTWLPVLRPRRLAGAGAPDSVAVTFDDGPDGAGTPAVLDQLDRLGLPATFFVLGSQVRRDAGLLAEVAARGHEIALHGDTHRYLIGRSPRAARDDLARGRDTVADITGAPVWWRPPYGVLSGPALLAARRLGLRPVIWTSWGRDWRAEATPQSVLADLTGRQSPAGGTLLLHDSDLMSAPGSWRTTVAALPALAERIATDGLTARRLSDHLSC